MSGLGPVRLGRVVGLAVVAGAGAVLVGCASQIDALAPVGGSAVTMVRAASIDVVTGHGLLIRAAPRCTDIGDGFSCVGSLTDGSPIVTTATADATTMTVLVGGRTLYAGSVQAVLDAAARGEALPAGDAGGAGLAGGTAGTSR